jgi:ABC-type oligopeptide transport system, ATPase component
MSHSSDLTPQPYPLLEVEALSVTFPVSGFGLKKRHVQAVNGVSLHIHAGETLGLVGESGSGKKYPRAGDVAAGKCQRRTGSF